MNDHMSNSRIAGDICFLWTPLGPVHTGRGAPCNMCMQIMEHTAVNGSVHTGCKQHLRVCMQICYAACVNGALKRIYISTITDSSWSQFVLLKKAVRDPSTLCPVFTLILRAGKALAIEWIFLTAVLRGASEHASCVILPFSQNNLRKRNSKKYFRLCACSQRSTPTAVSFWGNYLDLHIIGFPYYLKKRKGSSSVISVSQEHPVAHLFWFVLWSEAKKKPIVAGAGLCARRCFTWDGACV